MPDELPLLFSTVQGSAESRTFTLTNAQGEGVTTFTGGESLSAKLYAGDDATAAISPTLAWGTPPAVTLTISAGATVSLTPRPGYILAFTVGSTTRLMGRVTILAASASGTAATGDITYDELRRNVGNWVNDVLTLTDQAGWGETLLQATQWGWDQLLSRAEHILNDQRRRHGPILEVDAIEPTTGYDDGPSWGPSILPETTIRNQLNVIRGYLSTGKLIKSEAYKRMLAYYAAHLICEVQMTPTKDNPYAESSLMYRDRAIRALSGLRFEIDTDSDMVADYWI